MLEQIINFIFKVKLGPEPLIEKGCKRLTRRDAEQVRWQRVPTCGMNRQTHQGAEQACWQWGICLGKKLLRCYSYPTGVLNGLAGSGF